MKKVLTLVVVVVVGLLFFVATGVFLQKKSQKAIEIPQSDFCLKRDKMIVCVSLEDEKTRKLFYETLSVDEWKEVDPATLERPFDFGIYEEEEAIVLGAPDSEHYFNNEDIEKRNNFAIAFFRYLTNKVY